MIKLNVDGEPRPQGSKTPVRRGKKIILIEGTGDAPKRHKAWRAAVQTAAENLVLEDDLEQIDGPVEVQLYFRMPKPASKPVWKFWADRKPDLDKLVRAVLDSIAGKGKPLVREDSRVIRLVAEKRYVEPEEEPGVEIWLSQVEEGNTQATLDVDT